MSSEINFDAICDQILSSLPAEVTVWKEVIAEEVKHALQTTAHSVGLVQQEEVARLRKQLSHAIAKLSHLGAQVTELEQKSS